MSVHSRASRWVGGWVGGWKSSLTSGSLGGGGSTMREWYRTAAKSCGRPANTPLSVCFIRLRRPCIGPLGALRTVLCMDVVDEVDVGLLIKPPTHPPTHLTHLPSMYPPQPLMPQAYPQHRYVCLQQRCLAQAKVSGDVRGTWPWGNDDVVKRKRGGGGGGGGGGDRGGGKETGPVAVGRVVV